MEETIRRIAKVLGAKGVEASGHDSRFQVTDTQGAQLKVSIEGTQQRIMGVLDDAGGITRCDLDLAPVSHVTEDPKHPGRVTLHVGNILVHLDSQPSLAIEIVTKDSLED